MLPGKVKGIGGAMDLVANPEKTKVVVTMVRSELNTPPGSSDLIALFYRSTPTRRVTPRFWLVRFCSSSNCCRTAELTLLLDCTFPLTGPRCVSTIITDLAVFDVSATEGLTLIEHAEGVTVEEIRSKTAAPFKVAEDLKPMQL